MKFGITVPTKLIERGASNPYGKLYDYLREAEDLGFEFAAVGHHRFVPELSFGEPSAPFVMFAALLARTSRLRMLTSIALVATYHPLEVAEKVNTLAELSNGRFILGCGLGYRDYEFSAVGLDFAKRAKRYDEVLRIIEQALSGEVFSFHGEHFEITDVQITPSPVAGKPTPVWLGANGPVGVQRAAKRADGWIIGYPDSIPDLGPKVARYRQLAGEAGRPSTLCLMRDFHIAETRAGIDPAWLPNSMEVARQYAAAKAVPELDDVTRRTMAGEAVSFEDFVPGRAVAGTPEDCIREVIRARDALACEFMMLTPVGIPDPAQQMRELRLFAREVAPQFAA